MNKVYRLIWSAVRQCWIVAAEKVTAKGGIPARTVGALSVAALFACGTAHALPTSGTVAAGSASISSPSAGQMQITQTSNRAVINWQSFGIASGEAVNITQPSAQAALLNRVVGNSSSEIYGSLSANGQVFLINPNGVLFSKGSSVNVGGLVASSLNITDDNFMNNNLKFFKDGTAGSVINQGSITAGFAVLLGPTVDNSGSIVTNKGSTALGAANAVTLDFDTSGLIALTLDQGAYNAQVQNSGIIEADAGRVILSAKSADSILKSMVNTSGVIRARSVDTSSGQILLLGDMDNGTVSVGGTLDASALTSGNGGFIETSAAHVTVGDTTRVSNLAANGNNGTWLIDPDGFTIAASGGDMTGVAVQTALAGGNLSIASTSGSGSNGNINVNDTVSWSANKLTLTATNDINVNAVMTASGTSSLDLEPGSGKVNMGLNSSGFSGRVDFPRSFRHRLLDHWRLGLHRSQ
jgi:filamentous hemagglutinin family protein